MILPQTRRQPVSFPKARLSVPFRDHAWKFPDASRIGIRRRHAPPQGAKKVAAPLFDMLRPPLASDKRRPQRVDKVFCLIIFASFVCILASTKVSRLRARPKGFPIALWKPSVPYAMRCLQVGEPEASFLLQSYEKKYLFQPSEAAACQ